MESLDLTPAESLMIISPRAQGREMIKLTLIDLLLKRGIAVEEHQSEYINFKKKHGSIILSEGEAFDLNLKPHEDILRNLILEHSELELTEFMEILHKNVDSKLYKNEYIRDILVDKGYFKRQKKMLLSLIPHTSYMLTDEGLELKSKIMALLDEAENLDKWIKEDLGRAKAYLSVIGSHILLTNYDIDDIKKFNRILSRIKPESNISDYYNYFLYTIPLDYLNDFGNMENFDLFDISILDNFDSFDDFSINFDVELTDSCVDGRNGGCGE